MPRPSSSSSCMAMIARSLEAPAREALAAADQVLEAPAAWPLERCLDHGIAAARGEIVAKLDDDDLYGPAYLGEAVAALEAGLGDVVGKTELYVHLAGEGQLLLWRPGASQAEQDYVLGGTLAFRRSLGIGFAPPPGEPGRMFGFLRRVCRSRPADLRHLTPPLHPSSLPAAGAPYLAAARPPVPRRKRGRRAGCRERRERCCSGSSASPATAEAGDPPPPHRRRGGAAGGRPARRRPWPRPRARHGCRRRGRAGPWSRSPSPRAPG